MRIAILIAFVVISVVNGYTDTTTTELPVSPQEDTMQVTEESFNLDDFDAPEKNDENHVTASSNPHLKSLLSKLRINLIADFTIEAFLGSRYTDTNGVIYDQRQFSFHENHHFAILRISPSPQYQFSIELLERIYWEMSMGIGKSSKIRFGKIAIPFGMLPFHQLYGGLVEKPQPYGAGYPIMVPREWTEYGVAFDRKWVDGRFLTVSTKTWISNGFGAGVTPGTFRLGSAPTTLTFANAGGSQWDNNVDKAVGSRLSIGLFARYMLSGSYYTCKWENDNPNTDKYFFSGDRVSIWNVDFEMGYGSIKLPILRELRLRGGYGSLNCNSTIFEIEYHNKNASFVELTSHTPFRFLDVQLRFGHYDDDNRVVDQWDLVNYNAALIFKAGPVRIIPRYLFNRERKNERDDDYFILKVDVTL